ncbi:cation:proton antiporter [Rugamonas sp. CCM 8940]|uniref:cation:proton antiporter n=1 Tax=Rugamonas sp. CCM 8940 TaxID=2765359 RepID=UPI0018F4E6F2|nr:cation:proton antiporter [Rugamonas sp. CCM 8940]MBJ7309596.1 cation:proton antiporter [Rugamonas sp. CCM 8940]
MSADPTLLPADWLGGARPPRTLSWYRHSLHYLLLVGLPLLLLALLLYLGAGLARAPTATATATATATNATATNAGAAAAAAAPAALWPSPPPLLLMLIQIGLVLASARLVGALFRRLGQPQVVGEMIAGLMLGPSVLGAMMPEVSAALFPPSSLAALGSISQIGLLVYMFLVGLEFDAGLLRRDSGAALIVSHSSIGMPLCLGVALAYWLFPRFAPAGVSFAGFALFMGAAMSVTAFPVLARILAESGLARSRVGVLTLACAAVDDVTAWTILALAVIVVRGSGELGAIWPMLAGALVYLTFMFGAVRPLLRRLGDFCARRGRLGDDWLALALLLALASAAATEWLGLHALFGAFIAGVLMPRGHALSEALHARLEGFTIVLLLPLFFALAGLKTSIGLIAGWELTLTCVLVVAVAMAGKLGGATLSARVSGLGWRDAGAVGVLMNTRGLMELVILNVGLEIGAISPTLFTMMVIMALATTLMTSPLLRRLLPGATPPA